MPVGEVAGRAAQHGRRLTDDLFLTRVSARRLASPPDRGASSGAPLTALNDPGASAQYLGDYYPVQAARVVAAAQQILQGRFTLLGYPSLELGEFPNWHTEPVTGRQAPRTAASRIPYLDASVVGDSKGVWELNRHQFLITLGQAYQLTGDARYARRVWDLVHSWIRENPVGEGINWTSSLELAMRAVAWCWAWHLADGVTFLDRLRQHRFVTVLALHGRQIERYLSHYFSPNTHLTGEALGLCYLAASWPGLRQSARWWRKGSRILEDQIHHQFDRDGFHFERSACYQLYSLEFYLHYWLLCEARGTPVSEVTRTRLAAIADTTRVLQRPDGLLPSLGDDDGGKLMFLAAETPMDPAVPLATASVLFERPTWWPAGPASSGAVWLVGPTRFGEAPTKRRTDGQEPAEQLRVFSSAGFVVSKNGRGDSLYVSAGVQAPPPRCIGHVHDDALGLELWCEGRPVLLDPGTFTYTGDIALRNWYRAAAAHTTARVDGLPATPTSDPFRWDDLRGGRLALATRASHYHLLELERSIELSTGLGVHRRRIAALHDAGWLIWDRFYGTGIHDVRIRFQLAPEVMNAASASEAAGPPAHRDALPSARVMVLSRPDEDWSQAARPSPIAPIYGAQRSATALECAAKVGLPTDVLSIILHSDLMREALHAVAVGRPAPKGSAGSGAWRAVELRAPDDAVRHRIVLQDDPAIQVKIGGHAGPFTTIWMYEGRGMAHQPGAAGESIAPHGLHDVVAGAGGLFASLTPAGC